MYGWTLKATDHARHGRPGLCIRVLYHQVWCEKARGERALGKKTMGRGWAKFRTRATVVSWDEKMSRLLRLWQQQLFKD